MPELRQDPLTGIWVMISPERKKRPQYLDLSREYDLKPDICPFCERNEHMTPPEIYAVRKDNSEANKTGWKLRVVPNKYPALSAKEELNKIEDQIYNKMNGVGAHEVIIESDSHDIGIGEMEVEHIKQIFISYKRRILDLKRDKRFKYIQIFKNHGIKAGSSIHHPHSQIIALPVIPSKVMNRLSNTENYFKLHDRCLLCDILDYERSYNKRVLFENRDFIVFASYAPKFPFELIICPIKHASSYERTPDKNFISLAEILKQTMKKIGKVLDNPAYNLLLHNSPFIKNCTHYFHWHMELIPIISGTGGFELATNCYINPIPPEESIQILKN
jgi:UDPglucose--hexose-1-phosphate uridylyltransferase